MKWIALVALAACGGSAVEAAPAPSHAAKPKPKPAASSEPKIAPAPEPKADPKPVGGVAQQYIDAHNKYRAKHCAAPLSWSSKLADIAQKWANHLRDRCGTLEHSAGTQYGENLAAGSIGALDPTSAVDMWYDEIKRYKFPNGGFSMTTGHLTQLLWRSTRQVGCGHAQCKGLDIYVCEYDPPGNWEGQYRNEVLPASCKK